MANKEKIVFMGSPDFSLSALGALHENYSVVGVVTQPDRAGGRGRELKPPPVKELALELGIALIQPEKLNEPEAMEKLRAWAPDAIVVAAFGQILRQDVLDLPKFGCINVHASLLPRWRGAAPINAAILHGDEETGITIMKMDAGLDTGPILSQRSVRIKTEETAGSLFDKLSTLGAELLLDTLPKYFAGEIEPRPQPRRVPLMPPCLKRKMACWISRSLPKSWSAKCGPSIPGRERISSGMGIFSRFTEQASGWGRCEKGSGAFISGCRLSERQRIFWCWGRSNRRVRYPCRVKPFWQVRETGQNNHLEGDIIPRHK